MYLGSAQMDPQAESKVFSPDSNVSVLFVSLEWLFQNDDTNLRKVQKMREAGRMGLIAVDEAHLIYDWGMKGSTWRGREGSTWRGREGSTWRGREGSTWRGREESICEGEYVEGMKGSGRERSM